MKPFFPESLPLRSGRLDLERLLPKVARAGRALARYDGALDILPNPALLLSPLTANEALLSSRIEGTQATLDEVLEHDAGADAPADRRGDLEEVSNYRAAVRFADRAVAERGLTLSVVRETHQRLMQGVRGRDKTPGAFRTDQNWIGAQGTPIEQARFIPPDPLTMTGALENWQAYITAPPDDALIAAAVAHAQFEIIHPFNDGNGRIGRMLIPLILAQMNAISGPNFYISEYIEAHKAEYGDRLLAITRDGDWTGWVSFFCAAVNHQAESNLNRARALHALRDKLYLEFREATRSQHAAAAVDVFFQSPVIDGPTFYERGGFATRPTANSMLRQLVEAGLIECIRRGVGRRASRYAMRSIIRTAEGRA